VNVIKEIGNINSKLDALISILKGEEELFDPSVLQAELTKAQSLVAKSKSYIGGLQSTIKAHEATIASHAAEILNSANVESTVSAISSKFTETFADFENFLSGASNTVANSTPAVTAQTAVSNVAPVAVSSTTVMPPVGVSVAPTVETPTVIQTSASETIVEHSHVVDPRVQHVEAGLFHTVGEPTRIGPLVQ
jgi:hypothetical protein